MTDTVFACDALGDLYRYNEQLLWANKELLARCDLLEAELATLVDAVAGMFAAQDAWARKGMASIADWSEGKALYDTARAEVDRLIADCEGEE